MTDKGNGSSLNMDVGPMLAITDQQVWDAARTITKFVQREDIQDTIAALGMTDRLLGILEDRRAS